MSGTPDKLTEVIGQADQTLDALLSKDEDDSEDVGTRKQLSFADIPNVSLPTTGIVVQHFHVAKGIADGECSLLIQPTARPELAGNRLLLVSDDTALGVITLGEMAVFDSNKLQKTAKQHGISDQDIKESEPSNPAWISPPYFGWTVKSVEAFPDAIDIGWEAFDGTFMGGVVLKQPDAVSKPFSGYEDFDACVTAIEGQGRTNEEARAICGSLQAQSEKFVAEPVDAAYEFSVLDEKISVERLSKMSDRELIAVHVQLHQLYDRYFVKTADSSAQIEHDQLVSSAILVDHEIIRRGHKPVGGPLAEVMEHAGHYREQAQKALAKDPIKALEETGPPNEWSDSVAAFLGADQRKQLTSVWSGLSKKEKDRIYSVWSSGFEKRTTKPFGSPGGKDSMIGELLKRIPPHETYVEPYAGSATLFWAKERSKREVISDADEGITSVYLFLRDGSAEDFVWMRKQIWVGSERRFKRLLQWQPTTLREKAYRYKYLNLFSARRDGTHFDKSERARGYSNSRFMKNLEKFQERLQGVTIVTGDALETMRKFDGPNTFHYIDPPWKVKAANEHWRNFDAQAFATTVRQLSGKALVSYQGPLELGTQWSRKTIRHLTGSGMGGHTDEQLYANYGEASKSTDVLAVLAAGLSKGVDLHVLDLREEYDASWMVDVQQLGPDDHFVIAAKNTEQAAADMETVGKPFSLQDATDTVFLASSEISGLQALSPVEARKYSRPEGETFSEHAAKWVSSRGLLDSDSDYDGLLGQAILRMAKLFSAEKHSGTSAMFARTYFNWLCDAWDGSNTITVTDDELAKIRGVLAKQASEYIQDAFLSKDPETQTRSVKAIVYKSRPTHDGSGDWDIRAAVGPITPSSGDKWEDAIALNGRLYVPFGSSLRTSAPAKVGDVVKVLVQHVAVDLSAAKKSVDWTPLVAEISDGRPMTPKQLVNLAAPDEVLDTAPTAKTFAIIKSETEERFVKIVVLEPETTDAQGDIYSEDEIRRAAHYYMLRSRQLKIMHQGDTLPDTDAQIVESFVSPIDYEENGQPIKKGAWVMGFKIWSDKLWTQIKSGAITGVSIGGLSYRVPLAA